MKFRDLESQVIEMAVELQKCNVWSRIKMYWTFKSNVVDFLHHRRI